jgi:hypothetical protein
MKTKGLMFIALFISGATFAQSATVKQEQQVKAGNKTEVNAAVGGQRVASTSNTSTAVNAGSTTPGQGAVQATTTHSQQSAVTIDPSVVPAATGEVKSQAGTLVKTGVATGKATGAKVKSITSAAAHSAVQVNSAVNNSLKIHAAPINVKAVSAGAIGLKGL